MTESNALTSEQSEEGLDRKAIAELVTSMTAGFNAHDAKASTAMYLDDASLVTVRGEVMRGRAAFEEKLGRVLETRARRATLKTLDVQMQFIRQDVALVYVTNEMSGLISPNGETLAPHVELSLRVVVKQGGAWRVAAFHNTMVRPFEQ